MKMPPAIDAAFFAPCGMNCIVCYKHCYVKKPCAGCLPGDDGKPEHCRKCKIKDCIAEKNLTYCFMCDSFPCKLVKNLDKSYKRRYDASLVENSLFVKEHGGKKEIRIADVEGLSCDEAGYRKLSMALGTAVRSAGYLVVWDPSLSCEAAKRRRP